MNRMRQTKKELVAVIEALEARMGEGERKRAKVLARAQRDLGLALTTKITLEKSLQLCLETSIRIMEMDCGGIYLVDDDSGEVYLVLHEGLPPDFVASASHYDAESPSTRVIMAGKPIYTQHRKLGVPLDENRRREGLRALAIVPIKHGDRVIACVNLASHTLDEAPVHAREAIEIIADQIGSIIMRVKAEEALRESEEHYRMLFNNMPVGLYRSTPEGVLYDANPGMVRLFGYANREAMLEVPIINHYVNSDDRKWWREQMECEGVISDFEVEFKRADGSTFWVSNYSNAVLDNGGEVEYYEGSMVDITERKRVDARLKRYADHLAEMVEERTAELTEAHEQLVRKEKLAVLGQLAGSVSHDLRNPLAVITNAVFYLKATGADADAKTRDYFGIIADEVKHAEAIISDLLDYGRVQTVECRPTVLSEFVDEAISRAQLPDEVNVTTDIPDDFPRVQIDPRQVGQILYNILTNAVQAMPEGGDLTLTARAVDGGVALAVADTGCGITPDRLETIFEPLYTTRPRGVGLGLAHSRQLAEANGGTLTVVSELERGSTFTLTLPATEAQA